MVAYSFQPRFVEAIAAGTKRQTIRAERRRHAQPGEEVQLYTGMRTQHCRLIGRATCISVLPIRIYLRAACIEYREVVISSGEELRGFANADGFPGGWVEMRDFWRRNHPQAPEPWSGILIEWRDFLADG